MNTERMGAIADLLDKLPAYSPEFSINTWRYERHCGTVSCAFGHAMQAGLFPELYWTRWQGFDGPTYEPAVRGNDSLTGIDAVAFALGIATNFAIYLFHGASYPNGGETRASEVADRIRSELAS